MCIRDRIRAKEVRIVGDDVEPAVDPIAQALKMAEDHEADLVEISPNAVPPVCRIIDYSKFLYQLKKRQKAGFAFCFLCHCRITLP